MFRKAIRYFIYLSLLVAFAGCEKFLETKSDESLSTPQTLDDLEAMLRTSELQQALSMSNGSSDEYFFEYNIWLARPDVQKQGYIWDAAVDDLDDWRSQYKTAFYANTVLFNLDLIDANGEQDRWNNIKGMALFFRAHAFYQVAQLYALPYDSSTAATTLGIPLRLNVDINEPSVRSSLQKTYGQILQDLHEAADLMDNTLPNTTANKGRPTKAAAYALLARTYLQMGAYAQAKESAEACLALYNSLLDFNNPAEVNTATTASPFPVFNKEIIFFTNQNGAPNSSSSARIDTLLYKSFSADDWRKTVYFNLNANGTRRFKGSYNGGLSPGGLNNLFNGLATDEVYLTRAEAHARLGHLPEALQDLNDLLAKRWKTGLFTPFTAPTADQALDIILAERKKELINRGTRWSDIKRLNKDSQRAITLTRQLNGVVYSLPPGDPRFALLIPINIMNTSSLQQNPR